MAPSTNFLGHHGHQIDAGQSTGVARACPFLWPVALWAHVGVHCVPLQDMEGQSRSSVTSAALTMLYLRFRLAVSQLDITALNRDSNEDQQKDN
jgi:hypothetical protein